MIDTSYRKTDSDIDFDGKSFIQNEWVYQLRNYSLRPVISYKEVDRYKF